MFSLPLTILFQLIFNFLPAGKETQSPVAWETGQDGMQFAEAELPEKSSHGDSKVRMIRFQPKNFRYSLVCATENGYKKQTIDYWAREKGAIAAINAGMFHGEHSNEKHWGLTNTGYTRNFGHINNPKINADKACICFNPKKDGLPLFQIADRTCQNFQQVMNSYETVIQGIRLFDCNQKVVWQKDEKKWSMSLMLEDREGFIYFLHCRSPYTVNSFCNQLKILIPNVKRGIYLEGGPESSLFLQIPEKEWQLMGSYETGFREDDTNQELWPLANVVCIRPFP